MPVDVPPDAPHPRLCHLVQQADFEGYGFNLHAEKARVGQYVGEIDPGSPAEGAGLQPDDRIIEVNGVNVNMENHRQTVGRIKSVKGETKLLVADKKTMDYYEENGITIRGDMGDVIEYRCNVERTPPALPHTPPPVEEKDEKEEKEEEKKEKEEYVKEKEEYVKEKEEVVKKEEEEKKEEIREDNLDIGKENRAPSPSSEKEEVLPSLRLCHLVKWPTFDGYGFNLHAERGSAAHIVGQVDQGGPAQLAGLKTRDKIIDVNGRSVLNATHKDVVVLIREVDNETRLLVADDAAFDYYHSRGITMSEGMGNVVVMRAPATQPHTPPHTTPHLQPPPPSKGSGSTGSSPQSNRSSSQYSNGYSEMQSPAQNGSVHVADDASFEDNLKLSASEMRQKLSLKKKKDPKLDGVDMKRKHEIFQKM